MLFAFLAGASAQSAHLDLPAFLARLPIRRREAVCHSAKSVFVGTVTEVTSIKTDVGLRRTDAVIHTDVSFTEDALFRGPHVPKWRMPGGRLEDVTIRGKYFESLEIREGNFPDPAVGEQYLVALTQLAEDSFPFTTDDWLMAAVIRVPGGLDGVSEEGLLDMLDEACNH